MSEADARVRRERCFVVFDIGERAVIERPERARHLTVNGNLHPDQPLNQPAHHRVALQIQLPVLEAPVAAGAERLV